MPVVNINKRSYKLVEDRNDGLGKVPAYDEEAFQLGISFKAKYVGTLEITRPACRAEIVTAMRKVRYEFKIKGIVKRRVNVTVSVDGIKVALRKRRRRLRKESSPLDKEPVILHEHQIGRIFYVSHDSMDLKIFSYITKDNFDNQFRCSVFKAYRKSKALFVVRTIGQAFEVCHRLQQVSAEEKKETDETTGETPKVDEGVLADPGTDIDAVENAKLTEDSSGLQTAVVTDIDERVTRKPTQALVDISELLLPPVAVDGKTPPLTVEQLRMLFNQELEHYIQETEVFKAENQLLKDQLVLERNARIQAQEREHCLLQKNHKLLLTIQSLANRLQIVAPVDNESASNHNLDYNPGYPPMFSTPLKKDAYLDHFISGNSVVIPAIPPPPETRTTFEIDRKLVTDLPRIAPLATIDSMNGGAQSTVGLYWKTFDEDDIVSPENGFDDSSSDSSDDEQYSESFHKEENEVNVKMTNGGGNHLDGGKLHHNNGVLHNGLHHLPTQMENNNNFGGRPATNEVRTAIQTDF